MGFYEQIAKYYDYIFPVSEDTVNFINTVSGNPPKNILDVACGTGGYSIELANSGHDLTAIDLDSKMIEALKHKNKAKNSNIEFMQADMLQLTDRFGNARFDTVFCIGNSVVHLENKQMIRAFFQNSKQVLKDDGTLIIQIINFDRIFSKNINSLPTIQNDDPKLTFERYYIYENKSDKINFKTILTMENQKIQNEIQLTVVLYDELVSLLKDVGFSEINVHGDFNGAVFDKENSYMLVIKAKT